MTSLLGDILKQTSGFLQKKGFSNPRFTAEQLLSHSLNLSRLDLYTQHDKPLEPSELDAIRNLLKRAANHEPLAQIIGSIPFYNCTINVTRDVLIPRQETEQLVDKVVQELKELNLENKILLDLCTGSGCIGIAIKKKFPSLKVILSDICPKALAVAKKNAASNGVEATFLEANFLDNFDKKVDFVISNPPYVTEDEYANLDPTVKLFEPKLALTASNDGLYYYEKLSIELKDYLNPKALLFAEIGSLQKDKILPLFADPWRQTSVLKDLSGRDRFLRTVFP